MGVGADLLGRKNVGVFLMRVEKAHRKNAVSRVTNGRSSGEVRWPAFMHGRKRIELLSIVLLAFFDYNINV